jgi:hypothetical protein
MKPTSTFLGCMEDASAQESAANLASLRAGRFMDVFLSRISTEPGIAFRVRDGHPENPWISERQLPDAQVTSLRRA